jgi:hypothetical protein
LADREDRCAGHARRFRGGRGTGSELDCERQLKEHFEPASEEPEPVAIGRSVMRVVLATDGKSSVRAIWLDKVDAKSGYSVRGEVSADGGHTLKANEIVQDEFGAAASRRHGTIARGRQAWSPPGTTPGGRDGADEAGGGLLSCNSGDGWRPPISWFRVHPVKAATEAPRTRSIPKAGSI